MTEMTQLIQIIIENFNNKTLEQFLDKKPEDFFLEKDSYGKTILFILLSENLDYIFSKIFIYLEKRFSENPLTLCNIINQHDNNLNKLIHISSEKGNLSIFKYIEKYENNIKCLNIEGYNILHFASKGNSPEMLMYIKEKYNFDILSRTSKGETPLHIACICGAVHCVNFLLMLMDDINVINVDNESPIFYALKSGRIPIIKKLIRKGIDVNLKNCYGKSFLEIIENDDKYNYIIKALDIYKKDSKGNFISNVDFDNSYYTFFYFLFLEIICFLVNKDYLFLQLISYVILIILFFQLKNSNPGIVYSNFYNVSWLDIINKGYYINLFCPYCKIKNTYDTKHCFSCGFCIDGFDHHCSWIGNCVGHYNMNLFIFFLIVILYNSCVLYFISMKSFSNMYLINNLLLNDAICIGIMVFCLLTFVCTLYLLGTQIKNVLKMIYHVLS